MTNSIRPGDPTYVRREESGYIAVCPLCDYESKPFDTPGKAKAAAEQHVCAQRHRHEIARQAA